MSTVNEPTRIQNNSYTCLDILHIFLKTQDNFENIIPIIKKINITGHFTVLLQIIGKEKRNILTKEVYSKYINYKKLQTKANQISWHDIYADTDTECTKKSLK